MSRLSKWAGFTASALFIATSAHAQVTVQDPWVRATVPQQSGTGAFMRLTSPTDTSLVAADSPVAKHVEVHEMAMEGNVMKMRQVPSVALPAGKTVELKPGGYHIMLIDLHGQMKEDAQVPLTLTFENSDGVRSTLQIQAPVRPLAQGHASQGHGMQPAHGHSPSGLADPATAPRPEGVSVDDCWIRALPNRLPAAGYFRIRNSGERDAVLVGAQAEAFGKAMLHTHRNVNGMSAMVHVDKVIVPAGGGFDFAPGGHHVMLEQPASDLQSGSRLPITLWFEGGRALRVECDVRSPSGAH